LGNKRSAASADILPAFSYMLGKKRGFLSGWIRACRDALIPETILFIFKVQTQDGIYGGSYTICFA
jgi:hypothetical protein